MQTFRSWIEAYSESINEKLYIQAIYAYDREGSSSESGGEEDIADDDDYVKNGVTPGTPIHGLHYEWDISITHSLSEFLKGSPALYEREQNLAYYHSAVNNAKVLIEVQPQDLGKIKSGYSKNIIFMNITKAHEIEAKKFPQSPRPNYAADFMQMSFDDLEKKYPRNPAYSKALAQLNPTLFSQTQGFTIVPLFYDKTITKPFIWNGLDEMISHISKTQEIRVQNKPKPAPAYVKDPRSGVRPLPGEDREQHLMRAANMLYTNPQDSTYHSGDDYYKKMK